MGRMINTLIVEDEVLIAKHIEDALHEDDFKVIGIVHDSEAALDFISNHNPELIILDINILGVKDGIEVAQVVKEKYNIPFIFVTAHSDGNTLDRAKKVNPCAFIVKPFTTRDLLSSVTIGLYNFEFRKKYNQLDIDHVNKLALEPLSDKEFEVLLDIKEGLTNAQIAKKQYLAISTIKFHSKNIYLKLDVKNRTSAIKKIMEV